MVCRFVCPVSFCDGPGEHVVIKGSEWLVLLVQFVILESLNGSSFFISKPRTFLIHNKYSSYLVRNEGFLNRLIIKELTSDTFGRDSVRI